MRPKKSLGQNFLMHASTARRIVGTANVSASDTVLEIGPGTGMLTRELLPLVNKVIAVEADGALVETLKETFAKELEEGKFELIHADIREFSPDSIPEPYALVANIPYYITGEIIRSFLSARHKPTSMTLLVQKEVAVRIARAKKESLLSISVKVYGTPTYAFTVPRGAFFPAPSVDSAVLHIKDIRPDAFPSIEAESWFFEVVRAGFAHKRKLLSGNLGAVAPAPRVKDALEAAGLQPKARAEDVSLSAWRVVAEMLAV